MFEYEYVPQIICSLSEIWIHLGALYFIWLPCVGVLGTLETAPQLPISTTGIERERHESAAEQVQVAWEPLRILVIL